MEDKIRESLKRAFDGEAKASVRLKVFADKADKEGYPQIAELFRVIAASEEIHGMRALRLLRDIGSTEENLAASFESEESVARVAYNEFIREAMEAGNKAATIYFTQSRDVEETHAKLYKEALNFMSSDREASYYLCGFCGYVSADTLPDTCPVCGAKKEKFYEYRSMACR